MTAGHANNNCDSATCSLPHRWGRISESCLPQPAAWTTTTKRTEQNLIVHRGKSEAEVTNNRRPHSTYCTIEANYWQTQSIAWPPCDRRATCANWWLKNKSEFHLRWSIKWDAVLVAPFCGGNICRLQPAKNILLCDHCFLSLIIFHIGTNKVEMQWQASKHLIWQM